MTQSRMINGLQSIKRNSFIILFVLLLSCGSKKKVVSTNEYVSNNKVTTESIEEIKRDFSKQIDISSLEGKIIITEIEYDTNSIDSISGKPLVKKETTSVIDFAKKDTSRTENDIHNTITTKKDVVEDSNKTITSVSETKTESNFMSYLYKIIVSLIILIFSFLIYKAFSLYYHKK